MKLGWRLWECLTNWSSVLMISMGHGEMHDVLARMRKGSSEWTDSIGENCTSTAWTHINTPQYIMTTIPQATLKKTHKQGVHLHYDIKWTNNIQRDNCWLPANAFNCLPINGFFYAVRDLPSIEWCDNQVMPERAVFHGMDCTWKMKCRSPKSLQCR